MSLTVFEIPELLHRSNFSEMIYGNAAMLGGLLKLVRTVVLSWCVATSKLVAKRKRKKNNAFFVVAVILDI